VTFGLKPFLHLEILKSRRGKYGVDRIQKYYQESDWLYRLFWYNLSPYAGMHFGFWLKGTKTHEESLLNQYKEIIRLGKIKKGMDVLDAGCGVGGGAIYIAKQTGANVKGITISRNQVATAREKSRRFGLGKKTKFYFGDYSNTNFPKNSFDIVYGIESVNYANPKIKFLKEAYRILKPKGRLIISDGYCRHEPSNPKENIILDNFKKGWKVDDMITLNKMNQEIQNAGFHLIKIIDRTNTIQKSLNRMWWFAQIATPLVWLSKRIRHPILQSITDNCLAIIAVNNGVATGLGAYYTHLAIK